MRRCALLLLIALALALLAVGAQAQERGDAAGEPPAAPRMTRLSWSGLTIRAEWDSVARATGYDLRWTLEGQRLAVGAERAAAGSPAEFSVPRAGRWRVEVRARIGSGPSAARGEWSRPLTMRLYDPPPRLEVERFDGEYARLNWTGVGAHYELEWGERGGAKRLVRRDGRSPTLELGPLEGGKTYEFRVRARNNGGRSGYSPTAVFTPTGWRGGRPGAAYVGRIGQIYALWFPQRGAEWYELSWINAADPTETARVRVGTATSGGSRPQVPGQIGREGGFENGTWNVRVRAGPRGVWSPLYPLTLSNQPERLTLVLESSRELCTAGTLTEIVWKISGGSAPYALSVENSAVDVSADNMRINCGALTEAEAADEEAALAAKRITAVVTDSRGVRREAALDVARARALPAPTGVQLDSYPGEISVVWDAVTLDSSSTTSSDTDIVYAIRYRPVASLNWHYTDPREAPVEWIAIESGPHLVQMATMRARIEQETPSALDWTEATQVATPTDPQNLTVAATHDTITVSWDRQPLAHGSYGYVELQQADRRNGALTRRFTETKASGRHTVTFARLLPNVKFDATVIYSSPDRSFVWAASSLTTATAPTNWTPPPAGPRNLNAVSTHNSITVRWDAPHPDAEARYLVQIFDTADGTQIDAKRIHGATTQWTTYGSFRPIHSSTTYRVLVTHLALPPVDSEINITTKSTSATNHHSGVAGATSDVDPGEVIWATQFRPIWPMRINANYDWVDDPFDWRRAYNPTLVNTVQECDDLETETQPTYDRGETHVDEDGRTWLVCYVYTKVGSRYHAGLDIGADDGADKYVRANAVRGDAVVAVESGFLRLYNNDLREQNIAYYCPDIAGGLLQQIIDYRDSRRQTHRCAGAILGSGSGRTALIIHDLGHGRRYVTKYAHLKAGSIPEELLHHFVDPVCLRERAADPTKNKLCPTDGSAFVAITRGTKIGELGSSEWPTNEPGPSEDGFPDAHLHFEIRKFDGTTSDPWYSAASASGCGASPPADCTWTATRHIETIEDAEAHLPPLPASSAPRDPGGSWGTPVTTVTSAAENDGRHVLEITDSSSTDSRVRVNVEIAFWRPLFYSRYDKQTPRTVTRGVAGTRSGVDAYYTDALCGSLQRIVAAPDEDDQKKTEGERPRASRKIELKLGESCALKVLTGNPAYPPGLDATGSPSVVWTRADIALRDPEVTLTWVAELSTGTNAVRTGASLDGDALDLYTFTARRGYTYRFCTYPSSQSTDECADESDGSEENSNVAQLLIIGADGSITDGAVKNTSGLMWTVPDNAPLEGDYVLVVRRRARVEGSVDDYSYKLKYTVPPIEDCTSLGGALRFLICNPKPPGLSVASESHNSVTVSVTPRAGASSYLGKAITGTDCTAGGTGTPFSAAASGAAGGVRGTGNTAITHPFDNLTASTRYTLCVRSVRTISPSFVLESDWVSVSTTTKAEQLPKPGNVRISRTLQNSLTLSWSKVADAGGYQVKRSGSSTVWTLSSTRRSHTFAGLSSGSPYTLSVKALPKTGSAKLASEWEHEPGRTSSPPRPTPILRQPIDCLSSTTPGPATYASGCGFVQASSLLAVLNQRNSDVCAILHWRGGKWLRYGLTTGGGLIPGSTDFQINPGNVLTLGNCRTSSSGVSGASGLEVPSCPDAVKSETGPAVIDADASSCTTVRGGGALQISRGEYTLNVSLASDRDWFAFAPADYTGSSAGAFLFLDLTSGAWIALYPSDGFELERHTPTDAAGLPALLDAIAASASTPATE